MTNGYCTLAELKLKYVGVEGDPELEDAVEQASRDVDRVTLDQFYQEAATVKTFSVEHACERLPVTPYIVQLDKVEYRSDIDDDGVGTWTEIARSDMETDGTEVRFAGSTDIEVYQIRWLGDQKVIGVINSKFPYGRQNVRITGTWGRAEASHIVKRATIWRAIEILNREMTFTQSRRSGALSDAQQERLHGISGGVVG